MALIICPKCGHEVSETALTCPNCGFAVKDFLDNELPKSIICPKCGKEHDFNDTVCPDCNRFNYEKPEIMYNKNIKYVDQDNTSHTTFLSSQSPNKNKLSWKTKIILGFIIFICICYCSINNTSNNDQTAQNDIQTSNTGKTDTPIAKTPANPPEKIKPSYYLSTFIDDVSQKHGKAIIITSDNSLQLDFPYQGEQHGTLELRKHPRYGRDIIIAIEKGQILCDPFDGCSVIVSFDGKVSKYSAMPPSDNSTESLFISNYARFLANLKKSKKVVIELKLYQEGNQSLIFSIHHDLHNELKNNWK